MTDKDGKQYVCYMPAPAGQDEEEEATAPLATVQQALPLSNDKTPFELLERMSRLCLYRQQGVWTYEMCFKKHTRQFRTGNPDTKSEDFSCGVYPGDEVQSEEIKVNSASPSDARQHYVSHNMTGGAPCALTGASRTSEVRFMCVRDVRGNVIMSVREFPTCNYIYTVSTSFLCKHPQFKPPDEHLRVVNCVPTPHPNHHHAQHQQQQLGGVGRRGVDAGGGAASDAGGSGGGSGGNGGGMEERATSPSEPTDAILVVKETDEELGDWPDDAAGLLGGEPQGHDGSAAAADEGVRQQQLPEEGGKGKFWEEVRGEGMPAGGTGEQPDDSEEPAAATWDAEDEAVEHDEGEAVAHGEGEAVAHGEGEVEVDAEAATAEPEAVEQNPGTPEIPGWQEQQEPLPEQEQRHDEL